VRDISSSFLVFLSRAAREENSRMIARGRAANNWQDKRTAALAIVRNELRLKTGA